MKLKVICLWFLLCAVCMHRPTLAQSSLISSLVLAGQPAPGTGGGTYSQFGQVCINRSGVVVFNATVTGGNTAGGIFLYTGGTISPVALAGQPAPGTGGGTFFGFTNPQINNLGKIAFRAAMQGGKSTTGIFFFSDGTISAIALEGQLVSDSQLRLSSLVNHSLNDANAVAIEARTFTPEAGNTQGIFLFSNSTLSTIALPDGKNHVSLSSPSLNSNGAMTFVHWSLVGPPRQTSATAVSLRQVTTAMIASRGQSAPGTSGGQFASAIGGGLQAPILSASGALAFVSEIGGGGARQGIFLRSGESLSAVVLQGQLTPGTTGRFDRFHNVLLNNTGQLIFLARSVTVTPALLRVYQTGIFQASGGTIAPVALEGGLAPGTGTGIFSSLGDPYNRNAVAFQDALVVFVAKMSGGSANQGIFLARLS